MERYLRLKAEASQLAEDVDALMAAVSFVTCCLEESRSDLETAAGGIR